MKSSLATKDGSKNHRTYKYREKMDLMELARYVKNLDTELVVSTVHLILTYTKFYELITTLANLYFSLVLYWIASSVLFLSTHFLTSHWDKDLNLLPERLELNPTEKHAPVLYTSSVYECFINWIKAHSLRIFKVLLSMDGLHCCYYSKFWIYFKYFLAFYIQPVLLF